MPEMDEASFENFPSELVASLTSYLAVRYATYWRFTAGRRFFPLNEQSIKYNRCLSFLSEPYKRRKLQDMICNIDSILFSHRASPAYRVVPESVFGVYPENQASERKKCHG